ncbi:MAG: hypothetical protein KDD70_02290 [Bdellovibrionales bacterium]|nr:hypothetical protein [Bdellovibrionales bacterium]
MSLLRKSDLRKGRAERGHYLSPSKEAVEILEAERGETSESLVEALVLAAVVEAFNTRQDERELIVRAHRLAKVYSDEPGSIEYLGGIGLALTPKTQTTVIEPIARLFGYLQAEDGEPPSEPELVEV